jgi:hypothetical protein
MGLFCFKTFLFESSLFGIIYLITEVIFMKKFTLLFILTLGLFTLSCEDDPATTGTLIVILPGAPNAVVGLYDPASVTLNSVNTSDAIYIQSLNSVDKATFTDVLPGNYIIVFHENTFVRKGAQVKAGETVTVYL